MKRKVIKTGLFDNDLEAIKDQGLKEKIERRVEQIPASKVERVLNDPKAWLLRVGKKYVVLECTDAAITLLRILDQDDLYAPSLDKDLDG